MKPAAPPTYRSPWLTDELESFRGTVRRFVNDVLAPREAGWQAAHCVDADTWREVGGMGYLLADVPEAYGGSGGTFAHDCIIFEELAYAGVASFGKSVYNICAHYVVAYGTKAQKERWLPRLAKGELIGAVAMSEPGAGSDLLGIRTRAVRGRGRALDKIGLPGQDTAELFFDVREYAIARMYADSRAQRIYGGTNEIMKEIIARSL